MIYYYHCRVILVLHPVLIPPVLLQTVILDLYLSLIHPTTSNARPTSSSSITSSAITSHAHPTTSHARPASNPAMSPALVGPATSCRTSCIQTRPCLHLNVSCILCHSLQFRGREKSRYVSFNFLCFIIQWNVNFNPHNHDCWINWSKCILWLLVYISYQCVAGFNCFISKTLWN